MKYQQAFKTMIVMIVVSLVVTPATATNVSDKFKSMSALLSYGAGNVDGQLIHLISFHENTGVGGGNFYWSSFEPKANHNGGTIIDPAKTLPNNWIMRAEVNSWLTATPGGTGCWKRVIEGDIYVSWFGSQVIENLNATSANDASILTQKAVDVAVDLTQTGGNGYNAGPSVILPRGILGWGTTVNVPAMVQIKGYGRFGTTLLAYQNIPSFFSSNNESGGSSFEYNSYVNFKLNGKNRAQYGIYNPNVSHCNYKGLIISETTMAGIYHTYGWSSNFTDLTIYNNRGDGIQLLSSINGCSLIDCQLFNNDGFGLWLESALGTTVVGGILENNKKGGAYLNMCRAVTIDTYCEGNGENGYTFTSPSKTIKSAGYIINGTGNNANLSASYPSNGIKISGYMSLNYATLDCGIFAGAVDGLDISGLYIRNFDSTGANIPIFASYKNPVYCQISNLSMSAQKTIEEVTGATTLINFIDNTSKLIGNSVSGANLSVQGVNRVDYSRIYGSDPTSYGINAGGIPASITDDGFLDGRPIYKITSSAAGSSALYGFSIPISDIKNNRGDYFFISVDMKAETLTPGCRLYISDGINTWISDDGSALPNGEWVTKGFPFKLHKDATKLEFSIRINSQGNTDTVLFHRPVLSLVGIPVEHFKN